MSQMPANLDRLHELLADRAMQGLGRQDLEALELMLLEADDEFDRDELDYTAAAVDIALFGEGDRAALPEQLRTRIEADAADWHRRAKGLAYPSMEVIKDRAARTFTVDEETIHTLARPKGLLPWLAAAAAIALAAIAWWPRLQSIGGDPTLAEARAAFITNAPDLVRIPWNDAADLGIAGEVVWSTTAQKGYLTFRGLPQNNPQDLQYQLWIFDEQRPNFPAVDGGVFDALAAGEEVIVPINAKLEVFRPTLFAITTEPPGGVVKHDPELNPEKYRIILTAPVES